MKTLTLVLFFVLLSLVCGFGNAAVLYQNESQQIQISDQIIYGNIVGVTSAWNPQKTHIETTAQVLVNTTLKNIGNTTIGPGQLLPSPCPGGLSAMILNG